MPREKKIHKRDPNIKDCPFCTVLRVPDEQLTDDEEAVTCGHCRRMIERRKKAAHAD